MDHVGLPHVLVLAVHLVNLLVWIGKGNHSETFLLFAHVIIVSAPVQIIGFLGFLDFV